MKELLIYPTKVVFLINNIRKVLIMKKILKFAFLLLILILCLSMLCGCGSKMSSVSTPKQDNLVIQSGVSSKPTPEPSSETWAVYMYICGADLESRFGFATDNLSELKYKQIPENVKFVVETGGTTEWQNDLFDAQYLQRWDLNSEGFINLDNLPLDNMGEEKTLESFLEFSHKNYPADKTMLLIWDHGGGTCYGACWDENYPDTKSLSINDIHDAIKNTFGSDDINPPLDILAFDCCLMATIDVAELFNDEASYLLASEEVIPGGGYNYSTLIKYFKDNPGITPEDLGKDIIDGYSKKYLENDDPIGKVTLSLTDLSKINKVSSAVDSMFNDVLKEIYSYPDFFVDLSIIADSSENYGGNSRVEGYYNLVDIKDFASQCEQFIPSAKDVISAVDDAVLYKVNGEYRSYGGGLSMVYNYDANENDLERYIKNGTSEALKSFISITTINTLQDEEKEYVNNLGLDAQNLPMIKSFKSVDTSHKEVRKNSEGNYFVDFGPEVGACTTDAMYELYYIGSDDVYYLGLDDEIDCDFNEGIFINNFGGKWLRLGDWIACMDLTVDTDLYNIYSIPIKILNEEDEYDDDIYYLQVAYDFEKGLWDELGVRSSGSEPGTVNSKFLDEGTRFGVLQPTVNDDGNLEYYLVAELEYSDKLLSYDVLPAGNYKMIFRLEDVHKNLLWSDVFDFEMINGVPVY